MDTRDRLEPQPFDDQEFLTWLLIRVQNKKLISHAEVVRLRKLADYAETSFPSPTWRGYVDLGEARRAIAAARAKLSHRKVTTTTGIFLPK